MVQPAYIVRVFIASPGDVVEERDALVEVIGKWNATHSETLGIIIEPVKWETHASPLQGGRPQDQINRQLVDKCDICVGIFWTRLGTDTGVAASGTVEEYELFLKSGRPTLLYFSDRAIAPSAINVEQQNKLQVFKDKAKQNGLYQSYQDLSQFREDVFGHLHKAVVKCVENEKTSAEGQGKDAMSLPVTQSRAAAKLSKSAIESPKGRGPLAEALTDDRTALSECLRKTLEELEDLIPIPDAEWIYKELNGYDKPRRGAIQFSGTGETFTANFPRYRQPKSGNGSKTCILESVPVLEHLVAQKQPLVQRTFGGTESVSYITIKGILAEVTNNLLEVLDKYEPRS